MTLAALALGAKLLLRVSVGLAGGVIPAASRLGGGSSCELWLLALAWLEKLNLLAASVLPLLLVALALGSAGIASGT